MTSRLVSGVVRALFAAALWASTADADPYDDAVAAINKLPNIKVFNLQVPNGIVLVFVDPTNQDRAKAAAMICDALKASSAQNIKLVRFLDGPAHDKDDTIKIVGTMPCK